MQNYGTCVQMSVAYRIGGVQQVGAKLLPATTSPHHAHLHSMCTAHNSNVQLVDIQTSTIVTPLGVGGGLHALNGVRGGRPKLSIHSLVQVAQLRRVSQSVNVQTV